MTLTTNPGYGPNGQVTRPGVPNWSRENEPPRIRAETITKPNTINSFGSKTIPATGIPDKQISKPVAE